MGAVLMASAVLIGGNLIADVLQVVADPRLRDA
jgi:ABC-type dipeptide/oligopeptide/nickel transport system permease component